MFVNLRVVDGSFLSTLSLRRATQVANNATTNHDQISIHALLAESDGGNKGGKNADNDFYPRSPCGERRMTDGSICFDSSISIHALLAESDAIHHPKINKHNDFYPRSPCGERRIDPDQVPGYTISIHALLAESDRASPGP